MTARRAVRWLAALPFLSAPAIGDASAYTKAEGHGVIIPSTNYYWATSRFGQSLGFSGDDYGANGKFWKISESLWIEYGITDDLNLIVDGEYAFNRFENDFGEQSNEGFGDPQVGLKYRFWRPAVGTDSTWAAQVRIQLPADEDGSPSTGYHETEIEGLLIATRDVRWFEQKISLNGELGYRWRDAGAADVVEVKYSFNTMLGSDTMLLAAIDGDYGVRNQDRTLAELNPSLAPNYDRFTAKIGVSQRLAKHLWINPSLSRDVAGRNAGIGSEVKIGFWITF